jgi:hypothetical protein
MSPAAVLGRPPKAVRAALLELAREGVVDRVVEADACLIATRKESAS